MDYALSFYAFEYPSCPGVHDVWTVSGLPQPSRQVTEAEIYIHKNLALNTDIFQNPMYENLLKRDYVYIPFHLETISGSLKY